MKAVNLVTMVLVVVGAINWGLVALLQINLVDMIFGSGTQLAKIVYIIVGAAGVYQLIPLVKCLTGQGGSCCSS
jgi:uncharacterized membrane protein YuzA (DUF378 family)